MSQRIIRIGVLISGSGSNLQSIIDNIQSGYIPNAKVVIVVSSRSDAFGIKRAEKAGIKAVFIDPKQTSSSYEYSQEITDALVEHAVDLVCLAGFMRMIEKPVLEKFSGRIMNIHPALLPKFGGKGMYGHFVHEAVLQAGEKESGPTIHFVDDQYDHGPVILQRTISVLPEDTPDTLSERVLAEEHKIYPDALKLYCEGKLKIENGKVVVT